MDLFSGIVKIITGMRALKLQNNYYNNKNKVYIVKPFTTINN